MTGEQFGVYISNLPFVGGTAKEKKPPTEEEIQRNIKESHLNKIPEKWFSIVAIALIFSAGVETPGAELLDILTPTFFTFLLVVRNYLANAHFNSVENKHRD